MIAPSPPGPAVLLPAILPEALRRALGALIIELAELEITLAGLGPAQRQSALIREAAALRAKARASADRPPSAPEAFRNVALRVHALALNHPPAGEAAARAERFNPVPAPLPVKP
jgi:hypothetical protein